MIDIGDKIKRTRLKLGLTQEELAARTELSKGFISQLERNLTSPSIATLIDILEALGTDIADFSQPGMRMKKLSSPRTTCSKAKIPTLAQRSAGLFRTLRK